VNPTLPAIWPQHVLRLFAIVALLLCLTVALIRGQSAWAAAAVAPGTAITTGCEEETMFSLWRAAHGQPVFVDSTRIPFAAAYFNWLFYASYAVPLRAMIPALGDVWLVRISRLITTALALGGGAALCWLLRRAGTKFLLAAAIAGFVFFGPLAGWWPYTARPDVGALAFEVIGLLALLHGWRHRPLRAVVAAVACFYAAWSFKQTYVLGLLASLAFLLRHRQWRGLLGLTLGMAGLYVVTFAALGPAYRLTQASVAGHNIYYLSAGWSTLRDVLIKTSPLWLLLVPAFGATTPDSPPSNFARDARSLGLIGLGIGMPLLSVAVCKQGASSYYFLPIAVMLALASSSALAAPVARWPVAAACGGMAALQIALLTGVAGRVTLREQTAELSARWQQYRQLGEPRFSADNRLNLPWLNPSSPPLVLAYNYDADLAAGVRFEDGGVGGMIENGYFASLLLPEHNTGRFLGGKLSRYEPGPLVEKMRVYRLSNLANAPSTRVRVPGEN